VSLHNLHFIDSYRAILGKQTIKTTTKMIYLCFFNYLYFMLSLQNIHTILEEKRKKREATQQKEKNK